MNVDIGKKWVAALRGGSYSQTTKVLFDGEGYCCLGVLCSVLGYPFLSSGPSLSRPGEESFACEGAETFLPDAVRQSTGITAQAESDLVNLNDSQGSTFLEIAEYIEANMVSL